jgi:deoxyribose-phosphate aldolase
MVVNIGELIAGNEQKVYEDIKAVVDAACGTLVKVIIETCYLSDEEKIMACKAAAKAGADFVKTSTGFGPSGATAHDVALMKASIPQHMKVKASGGMRKWEDVIPNLQAGADRLGVSASLEILAGFQSYSNELHHSKTEETPIQSDKKEGY